jgi:hypothetical protein
MPSHNFCQYDGRERLISVLDVFLIFRGEKLHFSRCERLADRMVTTPIIRMLMTDRCVRKNVNQSQSRDENFALTGTALALFLVIPGQIRPHGSRSRRLGAPILHLCRNRLQTLVDCETCMCSEKG